VVRNVVTDAAAAQLSW